MITCPHCNDQHVIENYELKLIPAPQSKFIKYVPQIKMSCSVCRKFIKFAKQEEWLIELMNKGLGKLKFNESSLNKDEIPIF